MLVGQKYTPISAKNFRVSDFGALGLASRATESTGMEVAAAVK